MGPRLAVIVSKRPRLKKSPTTKGTIEGNNGGPRYTPYTRRCVCVCVCCKSDVHVEGVGTGYLSHVTDLRDCGYGKWDVGLLSTGGAASNGVKVRLSNWIDRHPPNSS